MTGTIARTALIAGMLLPGGIAVATGPSGTAAADAFIAALQPLCGQAFAGRIVVNSPTRDNDPMVGQPLLMHVRECSAQTLRIPFHVGGDRSRTWVITRTPSGLRLQHDHRHRDGSADAVTLYGGETRAAGSAQRQEFPVDAPSVASFRANGLAASVSNTWALELHPGELFVYQLTRPGREFRVEFDLSQPLPAPPAPWGADD